MTESDVFVEPFWADMLRLIQVYWATGRGEGLDQLEAELSDPLFRTYLEGGGR